MLVPVQWSIKFIAAIAELCTELLVIIILMIMVVDYCDDTTLNHTKHIQWNTNMKRSCKITKQKTHCYDYQDVNHYQALIIGFAFCVDPLWPYDI